MAVIKLRRLRISMAAMHAGGGWACLFPVCGWFEWPSTRVAGFYYHESSWRCSHWLRDCVWLRLICCRPDPCMWWNTWPIITDVPDLVWVAVVAPTVWVTHLGWDHLCRSAVISIAQTVPNLCVCRIVFLKQQVNWNTVCGPIQDLPWHNISSANISSARICCCWLDVMYQPRSYVWATRISLGLMINVGVLLGSSRRLVYGGPVIALGPTVKVCQLSSES